MPVTKMIMMPVSRTACRRWAAMNFLLLVPRLANAIMPV